MKYYRSEHNLHPMEKCELMFHSARLSESYSANGGTVFVERQSVRKPKCWAIKRTFSTLSGLFDLKKKKTTPNIFLSLFTVIYFYCHYRRERNILPLVLQLLAAWSISWQRLNVSPTFEALTDFSFLCLNKQISTHGWMHKLTLHSFIKFHFVYVWRTLPPF